MENLKVEVEAQQVQQQRVGNHLGPSQDKKRGRNHIIGLSLKGLEGFLLSSDFNNFGPNVFSAEDHIRRVHAYSWLIRGSVMVVGGNTFHQGLSFCQEHNSKTSISTPIKEGR